MNCSRIRNHSNVTFFTGGTGQTAGLVGALATLFKRLILALTFFAILVPLSPQLASAQSLKIISDPYPPLGYVKDGEIVGFTVDIIRLILEQTGIKGTFSMYPWARAYLMAQKEENVLIYQLTYTKERENLFQLVGPIIHGTDSLWKLKSRKDIVIQNLEDAKRYRVGTVRDYFTSKYLLEHGFELGKNVDAIEDDNLNVKKLLAKRIDLMFLDEITFNYRVMTLGYNRDDFENVLSVIEHDAYIGFSKSTSKELVSQFAQTLDAIKADGSYDAILRRYGVGRPKKIQN